MMAEYYNLDKLKKHAPDVPVSIVLGARRIGKTVRFKGDAIDQYLRTGEGTMWLRNKKVELEDDGFKNTFLNMPDNFIASSGKKLVIPEEFECRSDGVYADKGSSDCVIPFQSVSTFSNRRGNMALNIKDMVFDEFMPEDRRYPKHCFKGLMSLCQTVLSGREDAKLYMLSNYISAGNPYMSGWRVIPSDMDVTVFADKGIAIEVCRGYKCAIEPSNPWTKVYRAGRYQSYSEASEDSLTTLIKPIPQHARRQRISVIINGTKYGVWYADDGVYWSECKLPVDDYTFVAEKENVSDAIGLFPKLYIRDLREQFELNALRFSSVNAMFDVFSLIFDDI